MVRLAGYASIKQHPLFNLLPSLPFIPILHAEPSEPARPLIKVKLLSSRLTVGSLDLKTKLLYSSSTFFLDWVKRVIVPFDQAGAVNRRVRCTKQEPVQPPVLCRPRRPAWILLASSSLHPRIIATSSCTCPEYFDANTICPQACSPAIHVQSPSNHLD